MHPSRFFRTSCLLATSMVLTACGIKGGLYLPAPLPPVPAAAPAAQSAPAADLSKPLSATSAPR